jgi:alpha-L-fucosidase
MITCALQVQATINKGGNSTRKLAAGVESADKLTPSNPQMNWWREAKFGMFVHWGVYSVPAGFYHGTAVPGIGEWIMNHAKIPTAEYQQYAKQFDPTNFNADTWVKIAKDAGMKYIVITAKHHDGFAMWPSKVSKWNIYDAAPWHHDPLKELAEACRKQGIRLGFYYSQAQDWNNGGAVAGGRWDPAQRHDMDDYIDNIAVPQVKELMTNYGPDVPAIIWWDTPIDMNYERAEKLYHAVEKLKPDIIMNNRLGGGFTGDYQTPEQYVPVVGYPSHDWETCMTINDTWGYKRDDHDWKSAETLIQNLADIASKGGNFLLNVGPTSAGVIPGPEVDRLQAIGRWMKVNGQAIYGTSAGPFPYLSWGVATRKGEILYLHVFDWPKDGKLRLPLRNRAKSAWLLAEPHTKLSITRESEDLVINIPPTAPDATPAYAVDGTDQKAWRAPKDIKSAWLELKLVKPVAIGGFGFDAPDVWPRLKQHFRLEAFTGGGWHQVAEGKTEGYGVQQAIGPVTAQRFRLTINCDTGSPGVAELQLYGTE